MKTSIQESLKQLVANRYLLVLSSGLLLLSIIFIVYIAFSVQPSELQLVSHYSAFGITHLYRDQWFYLFVFAVFGLFAALLHIAIGIKMMVVTGPSLAQLYIWFGYAIIIIAWITSFKVLNVWSPIS